MATLKISQLTDGSPLQAADQLPIDRGNTNDQITGAQLALAASPAFTGTPRLNGNSLIPASEILETSFTLTAAVFKTLNQAVGTNVTVIAAPGAGLAIMPVDCVSINMQYGGTAYTAGGVGSLTFYCNNGGVNQLRGGCTLAASAIKATSSQLCFGWVGTPSPSFPAAAFINQPLAMNVNNGGTVYATGNSNFIITVRYRIVAAS